MESNSNPLTTETQSILPLVTSDTFTPAHQNQQGAGLFSVEEQLIQDTLARASEWKISPLEQGSIPTSTDLASLHVDNPNSVVISDAALLNTLFPKQQPVQIFTTKQANSIVALGKSLAIGQIQDFLNRPDYLEQFKIAFGQDIQQPALDKVIKNWERISSYKSSSKFPKIEVVSSDILGKADGGFDTVNNKIYLSSNLIDRGQISEIVPVIIEEIGHYLDSRIHPGGDAAGDEGEIFSKLVRGVSISAAEYVTLINEDDHATIILNNQPVTIEQSVTTNYAIKAEKLVSFNGSSDLDGNPLDLSDDALVYGGKGFTFNGNSILPVKYDANNNPLKDSQGKLILVDKAVTVAAGYLQANVNGTGSKYAGLTPPQIVTAETVTVPLFADIKQQELTRRIPTGTPTTIFNISTSPINTAADWATKFPPAGTATVPKVVNIKGGGLNIPGNVNLSNYVIIVDSGDINFNGTGSLSNVTLVTSNGNINLNSIQSDNLSVLASGTINHNSSARFGGNSLFANGTGNIIFNGATKGITANDNLWVISQGGIIFNGIQSTRGSFITQGDFIANGSTDIYGTVSSKQNIIFNGLLNFTYASIRDYRDGNPPVIFANLVNDSGTSNSDKITNDGRISGTVTDASQIAVFKAGFDSKPLANYVDVLPYLTNGSFSFTKAQLETIYGGTIPDGSHTLNLIATDQYGNQSSVYPYIFTLDTTIPIPTLNLATTSDTGIVGDYRTKSALVTLTGKTEANARVLLSGNPTAVTADSLGNYTFANVALVAGNNSFTVTATDIAGNQKAYTQIVYRTSPPTGVSLGTPQVLENSANNTQVGALNTTDPDGVDNYVYALVDNAGGRFKLVGDKIQVANGSLLDFEANTQHQIQVRTTDGEGDSYLQTIVISVLNVNESPNNLLVLPTVILENSPNNAIVGKITSTDPDVGDSFSYSLVAGTGDGDNSKFAIYGDKLVIKNSPDYETQSSYTIRLRTTDAGGLTFEKQVTISVTNVNEAPTSLTLSNSTIAENSGVNGIIGTFTSTDPDVGDTRTYALTSGLGDTDNSQFTIVGDKLQLNPNPNFEAKSSYQLRVKVTDAGGLSYQQAFTVNISDVNEAPTNLAIDKSNIDENSAANSVVGNLTTIDPDLVDTASYTLVTGTGDSDNSKFVIAGNKLQINQSPDFETQSSYSIRIRTTDKGGLTLDKVLTIGVNNLNEAPTSLTLSNTTVAENSGVNGIIGTFTSIDPDLGDTRTYTLTGGLGDIDNSQFTIVGDKLQINPNPNFETKSSYQLRARVTDAGGLSYEKAFTVAISDVNEAPTALNISNTTLAENVAGGTIVGNLSAIDPDTNDNQTFSLVAGTGDTNNNAFNIVGTQLVINNSPNFEAQNNYSLRVRVSDKGGLTFDRVLTVNITDVNEAPTAINLLGNTIAENSSDNSTIGILTTIDPDLVDTASYTLTDNASGRFKLVGNELKVASGSLLDFEANTQHQITILSTDKGGLTFSRQFTIGVTNVNEIPIDFSLSNNSVAENTPVGGIIGYFSTIDPDLGDTHTYSLVNGTGSTDNSAFAISNNQLKFLVSPNFETKSNYSLRVRTTDAGGLSIEKQLTVNITNVNEAPTQLVLDTTSVAENLPIGTLVGKFTTTDPDAGDTHSYSLVTGNGSSDNAKFNILNNELRLSISPDFETQSVYHLRVQTKDAGGLTWVQELTVNIIDLVENQAPTAIGLTNSSIAENSANNTLVAKLSTTDPDSTDTHTYTLLDNAGGRFKLVGDELRVANGSLLDFETANSHQIRLRTTDNGTPNLAYERNITIGVTNVNETPVFISNPVLSVNAGEPYSYLITTIDPDTGDTRQITLERPLPSWLNLVDNGNGTATLSGNPSASNTGLFNIALAVTDAAGLKSTQEFNLGVVTTLIEGTTFDKRLEIPITVPATGTKLSFKLDPLQFDDTDLKGINDAFEVALVNAQGKSLVSPFQTGRDAFFNWTEGENVVTGKSASYDAATKIVTLDLTGVTPGTAKLVFRLINDDKDTTTSLKLTNLTLSPQLLPLSPTTPSSSSVPTTPTPVSPTFFNSATDVSPSILADYHRTSFNEGTKELDVNVALKNQGTYDLNGTLVVVVNHLSDPSIAVKNADGFTPEGLPYYTFTTVNGKLDPTQVTGEKTLVFKNPKGIQFSYDLTVLSAINAAPVITSVPTLEVIAGQKYQYSVKATDLNGDTLTYKLLSSPNGMTIDPSTGVVNWNSGAVGNYQLSVVVNDGRGGVAQQDYTLAVTNTPPNRPPVFTTNPVVDAYINQLYKYDSTAVDPDGDNPISYSLVIGPNGMVVNPVTGTVKWTAPPAVILGDTVLGSLRTPGESSKFSFGGIKGQRIYLDPLQFAGAEGNWRVDVISPSGNKIVNGVTLGWYANQLLTLTENGNYQVVISGVGDTVGSFGFRTTDLGLVPVIPFDTVVKDRLDLGSADKVYRFTGNQGQKLYFDKLSQTGDLDWVIYDAANRVVATNYYFDDIEVDLPANGEYILALRGRSALTTPVDFSFNIVQPEFTTTAISVNTIVSGAIVKKGSQSTYTFTGSAGQQLFYDALGGDYFSYKFIDPAGKEIFSADSRYDRGPDNGLVLTANGTYKIVVDGVGEGTGNYQFKLLDKATAPTISFDTDIIGQFATLDSSNVYHFTLDTDRYIYFDAQAGNYPNHWLLYGGDGKLVADRYIYDDAEFKVLAGDYFLVMQGNGSGDPNYRIRLVTPEFPTAAMNLNTVVSGSIVKAGEQDTYTFNGVAGQRLFYDALAGSSNFTRTVYDPSGRALSAYSSDSNNDIGPDYYTLSATGTYKVVIDGTNNATGNYKFRLLDSSVATPISLDTEITGAIDQNGIGTIAYKFIATAGQHLYLNTGAGQAPNAWIVYGLNGQNLGSGNIQDNYYYGNDDREFDITATGEYLFFIEGGGAANTNYKFTISDSQFTTNSLIIGNKVSASIAKQGQQNTYTFSGTAGQELQFDILNRNGNNTAYLYDQSGTQIFARNLYDLDAADLIILKETGNYRLVIDGNGATTDAYSFRLLDVKTSATNISLDTDINGQLTSGQETKFYQFTGNKGQRLYLDWLTSSPNTQWSLYDSAGHLLDNRGVSDYETTLPNSDTYTIAIRGYNDGVIDYGFRLITPDITTTVISLGTNANPNIIAGKIDEKGEIDTYTFSGTVGQKIYLDVINSGNSPNNYIRIYNSVGQEVLNQGLWNGDTNPIVLTTTGNYRVEIDGNGESTDSYQFSLLDLSQAINLSFDTPISGTLSNGASTQFYKFNGTAGQRLNFDSSTTGSNSSWTLYDNYGQIVMNDSLDRDREVTFNYTGSYLLGIKGNSASPVNYQFQVAQLAPATPITFTGTQLAFNTNISGSISPSTPNGYQSFTFTGVAGQKLFYDGLGGEFFGVSLQDPTGQQAVLYRPYNYYEVDSRNDIGSDNGLTLAVSGTYHLTVRFIGYYGNYNFRLLDLSSAPQISLDTALQGSFTPNAAGSTAYRFTLTEGKHLSFDAQQGDGAWLVYKPNGQLLTSARLSEDRDLWLDAGEYSLVMQGYSSNPNYKFKLVDLSAAPIINLNTDIQGTFSSPATNVQSYRFNVTQQQSLYFDAQQGDGAWYVFRQDGSLLTSGRLYEDRQIDIAPGEYQLAFQGYNSSPDYKLRIVTPQSTTTAISTNSIISGSIAGKGDKNTYTFTGTAGQQLFYDGLNGSPLTTRFYDPTGKLLYALGTQSDLGPDNGLTLTSNGTYTMVVDGNGEGTGSYQFQLLDKATSIPIAFDTDTAGQLATVNSSNAYHFSLTSDRYIYFDAQAGNYPNHWLLYGGDGKLVADRYIYDDAEFKVAAGDYFLVMEGNGSGDRNYQMRLSTPEFTTIAMSFNTAISGSITKAGEQDTYTFNGVAGQHLFYDALGGDSFNRTIYDPSGRILPVYYYGGDSRTDIGPDYYTLNTTGTYKVVIDGNNNATGNYKFRLIDDSVATSIALDTEITGVIDQNGIGSNIYKFTATAGQHLYLNTGSGQYPNAWIIYKPNGELVNYGYIQDNYYRDDFEFDVPTSGDYLFFIEGNGAASPNYKFTLSDSQFTTNSLVLGNTVTGAIAKQGQQNTYTFNGTAGEQLQFDILNRNGNNTAYLYDQSGTQIFARNLYDLDVADLIVLKETGNYRLVIDGNGATTDPYTFRLLDVKASATNISLDTDITGQLTSGQETKFYQFTGDKGQKLYLDWLNSSPNTQWSLYDSAGHIIDNRWVDDYEATLPNSDTYTIAIRGYNDGIVNYGFRLITPDTTTMAIDVGGNSSGVISGAIAERGEVDVYTFTGKFGQQLVIDKQAIDPNISLRMYTPAGVEVNIDSLLTLTEAGTYRIVINGNTGTIGNYGFRLLDKANATQIAFNTEISGSFGSSNLDNNVYRFSGVAGQHLYLNTGDGDYRNSWTLYTPGGVSLTSGTVANDYYNDGELNLPGTGEYLLVFNGNGYPSNNYRFTLVAPELETKSLGLGVNTTGSISKFGESDTYVFAGTIGQQLYFDTLTGNVNIKAQLFSPTGTLLKDGNTSTDWGGLVLSETGDYKLVIDGVGRTVGNYSFNLSNRASAPILTIGQTINDSLSNGNGNKYYQINGRVGQVLKFDLSASNWVGANWIVYDPAGNIVATPAANSPDFQIVLSGTGIYTLGILGNNSSPVSYSFQVSDVTPTTVTNSGFGTIQSGTVAFGELKEYNFTAKAGTVLLADSINDGSIDYYSITRLVNPDGTYGFSFLPYYGEVAPVTLQQTGNYKIQNYRNYYGVGAYKYQLLELPKQFGPTTNYLELGEVISGSVARGEDKIYTFQAVAGEKVLLNGISGYGVNANLYDAAGNRVLGVNNLQSEDTGLVTLQDGIYNLVIATSTYTGDYSFQLLDSNYGQKVDDNIAQVGSISNGQVGKFFKVAASVGDKLYFDSVSSTPASGQYYNYRWQLFDAGGNALFNTYQNTDASVTASATGDYYLYLQGGADSGKIDYNFRVFANNDAAADIITPGTGTGSTGADNLGLFNVKLGATDSRGASSTQDYQVKLWADPNNTNPVITSQAVTKFALADKGYRYQMTSIDADGDKVIYQLLDAPTGAVIDKDTGELLWIATTNVKPGDKVNFKVRVNDKRGGTDTQTFTVDVFGNLGTIQGAVFDDLNNNGLRDTKLVKGDNPAIVLAIDVSGSTIAPFYGRSRSKTISTVLEAEIAAAELMIDSVIAQGGGDKVKFAIIPHAGSASIQDMDLTTPGVQIYTTANADRNGNGIADIREILHSYTPAGSNNFTTALTQIDNLFTALTGDPNLIFLSDGYGRLDPAIASSVVADIKAKGGNVSAFGIGEASTIATLQKIDPTAIRITDFQQLVKIFSGFDDNYAIEPLKQNVTVYLDVNNNGILDPNEPNQITRPNPTVAGLIDTSYNYSFNNLLPGNYTIRTLVPNGYALTTPAAITDTVTVNGGEFTHLTGIGKITPPVNVDPVFITTAPTGTKLPAGGVFTYRANAVDNNADPLTYSLINAPTGMTVDPSTGIVVWNPTLKQVENYYQELYAEQARLTAIGRGAYARTKVEFDTYLRVSDGQGGQALQVLHLELLPNNRAPIFTSAPTNTTPQIGKVFAYTPTAVDPDKDPISYGLVGNFNPAGVTVDPTTGKVTWTPTAAQLGSQQISLQVTDSKGGSSVQKLDLTVINPIPNRAPEITSTPRAQTGIGQVYVYQVAATDKDGDKLTYTLTNPPAGMVIDTKGLITWTPTAAQSGVKNVAITVSDGTLTTQQTYALTVGNTPINHSPEITSTPTFTTNLDKTYSYQLTGKDSDNDTLFWSLDNAPTGMVIDATTGIIKWNPTSTQLGTHTIAVRLTDAYGLYVGQEYTLKVNGVNTPPQIQSSPNTVGGLNSPYKYQVKAIDLEGDTLKYTLGRRPTGMVVDANTGLITWTPNSAQIGIQTIDVLVTDAQGAVSTQTYNLVVGSTPINQPPNITSTPKFTTDINTKYQYQIVATDPENQQLTYALTTAPNGMVIDANTGLITWNNPILGNTQINITATDTSGAVATQGYTLKGTQNNAPTINSTPKTQVTIGNTYRYDVIAKDSDNDALTYTLDNSSQAAGITIDKLGRITWKPNSPNIGIKPVTVTVADTNGAVVTQTYNLEVLADNTAPVINLVRGTNTANIGETISFQVNATDNVGIKSKQLLIDNQAVTLDSNGVGTYQVTTAGIITATAIVTDINGNTSTANTTTNIIDPTDIEAPNIKLDLSSITNGIITGRTDIKGTVTDTNLDYYTLEVARFGTDKWQEVFRGTTSISNGTLGKFDPSLLENDTYRVRLTAYDTSGRGSQIEDELSVTGDLKLGNFRLSFTDLTIPVTGIPISLTRTYDSLTAGTTDDFGYGWRMEFRDTDLRTSLKKDEYYEQLDYRTVGFNFGTRIYITLPGGKREGFTFEPKQVQGSLGGVTGGRLFYPNFVADKGVTSTLTVPNAEVKANTDPNSGSAGDFSGNANGVLLYKEGKLFNLAGRPYVPQDDGFGNRYILTTKDGTQYEINATTGDLESVKDTNGNTLTYSDTEIKSSTGVSVKFERDNQGRIISVTDPLGAKVVYGYDAKGDLVSVKDRDGNTTQFGYNSSRAHYLDKIVDPLGREAVKTEYDEAGRLKKTANSSGNGVEFVYNPANSLETVKDALGNPTTYEYDVRGNVVTEVDAVGKVTKSTYDDDNNMLSETVISDRSGAAGFTTTYTYDGQRNKLSETDALGNTTYYTYGEKGRLLTTTDALGRTNTNAYDGNVNLISSKDAKGQNITIIYNSRGQLLSMKDPVGQTGSYTYDGNGNVATTTDILGHVITYNFDGKGNLLSNSQQNGTHTLTNHSTYDNQGYKLTETDTLGNTTTYTYNSLGQKIAVTDALGRVTRMVYDNDGRMIETILPDNTPNDLTDNPRTQYRYDALGQAIESIDVAGKVTRMVYDSVGRVIEIIEPDATPNDLTDNPRTKTEYYSDGLVKASIDELGHRTEYRYDSIGRQIVIIYADSTPNDLTDNPTSRVVYDAVGEVTQAIDALGRVTKYIYDELGQLTTTKFADGSQTSSEYDKLGRKIVAVDQNGNQTKYQYDGLGRLLGVKNALQDTTTYNYDEVGRLLSMTDAEGHSTNYEYDDLGRRTATILPLGQRSSTSYDAVGDLITSTDFNGRTTTFSYDAQNRAITKLFQDGNKVNYSYTIDGLLDITTMFDSNGQVTAIYDQDYDVQNRLIKRTDTIGGVSRSIQYGYDLASNKTSVTTASGVTIYTYDERNRLDLVKLNGSLQANYDYDAVNNLTQTTFGNGTKETRNYDLLDRLNVLATSRISDNIQLSKYVYALDKAGNRTQVQETENGQNRTVKYNYDAIYRLTQEQIIDSIHGDHTSSYSYDKVGNRLTKTLDNINTVYSYDTNDRLLSETVNGIVTAAYTYDNNGSTLTKREGASLTSYTWNDDKRLIRANVDGTNVEYGYNDRGIRVSSKNNGTETRYLLDDGIAQVWEEYSPTGDVKVAYDYGYDLISQTQSNRTSYYLVDGLGSTRLLVDTQGQILNSYDYDGFGKTINTTGSESNKYQFAGEQFDATLGDYYLRDRFYDTDTGRFGRRDNYLGQITEPSTLHKYSYTSNNPINSIDLTGFYSMLELTSTLSGWSTLMSYNSAIIGLAVIEGAVVAASFAVIAGLAIGVYGLVVEEKDSEGNTNLKIFPDTVEEKNSKNKKYGPPDDLSEMSQLRLQIQDAPGHTLGIPMYNTKEIGVTLTQVYQASGAAWLGRQSITNWLSRDYDTAVIKGLSFVTQTAKNIQENGGTSGKGGEQLASYQWDKSDYKGRNSSKSIGSNSSKKYYRVDFENLRGKNLRKI